jgi:DNA-binding CsgD family transcriptional regulator
MVPDITVAEKRMAALIRLHLNTKQMASMLGISTDSVYKIRQRLRKRLQLDDELATETYLTKI